jgi:hypothetical protein
MLYQIKLIEGALARQRAMGRLPVIVAAVPAGV